MTMFEPSVPSQSIKRLSLVCWILFLVVVLLSGCASPTSAPAPSPTATLVVQEQPVQPTAALPTSTLPATPQPTDAPPAAVEPFTLTSPAFADGGKIADPYVYSMGSQCSGANTSLPLEWSNVPAGTRSFALTMVDPDGGDWVHWVLFNIPPEINVLPESVEAVAVGTAGKNDFNEVGYGGPCPPGGNHHYVLTLYALDTTLDLQEGAKFRQVVSAIQGHILAQAQLTGTRAK